MTAQLGCIDLSFDYSVHLAEPARVDGGARSLEHDTARSADLGRRNWDVLRERYSDEWALRGSVALPFRTCLALSGGGKRSASIAIGAMSALEELEWMEKVDAISAVSGGSYALTWLYAQQYYAAELAKAQDKTVDLKEFRRELLDVDGNPQAYLAEHGGIYGFIPMNVWVTAFMFTVGLPVIALNWAIQLLMGPDTFGLSLGHGMYHRALSDNYLVPVDRKTGERLWLHKHDLSSDILFDDMKEFVRRNSLPLPIIGTEVSIGHVFDDANYPISSTFFELSPVGAGSDAMPLPDGERVDLRFDEAMAVSGAALDFRWKALGKVERLFGFSLGENVQNSEGSMTIIPFWLIAPSTWVDDRRDFFFHLSDGGVSDNLAAFALVRRGCDRIMIIDSTEDPNYEFEHLKKLEDAILAELGMHLSLARSADRAVSHGKVGPFPLERPGEPSEDRELDILYIKPVVDCDARSYRGDVCKYKEDNPAFPHEPTTDQHYDSDQFRAYRDLGYELIMAAERSCDARAPGTAWCERRRQ